MLFLGTQCPSTSGGFDSFNCLVSNDDACTTIPGITDRDGVQSRVGQPLLPGVQIYYVLVQPYIRTSGSYVLSWRVMWPWENSPSTTSTPSPSASASSGTSNTASASVSPSPTPTITPSITGTTKTNAFRSSSVLLLKAGGPAYVSRSPDIGEAIPLFFDELSSTASNQSGPLQSIALPTSFTSQTSAGCTLAIGATKTWLYEQEGLPTLSLDGRSVTLPCYSATVGNDLALNDYKTVGVLWADGRVETSTFTPDIFKGPATAAA